MAQSRVYTHIFLAAGMALAAMPGFAQESLEEQGLVDPMDEYYNEIYDPAMDPYEQNMGKAAYPEPIPEEYDEESQAAAREGDTDASEGDSDYRDEDYARADKEPAYYDSAEHMDQAEAVEYNYDAEEDIDHDALEREYALRDKAAEGMAPSPEPSPVPPQQQEGLNGDASAEKVAALPDKHPSKFFSRLLGDKKQGDEKAAEPAKMAPAAESGEPALPAPVEPSMPR